MYVFWSNSFIVVRRGYYWITIPSHESEMKLFTLLITQHISNCLITLLRALFIAIILQVNTEMVNIVSNRDCSWELWVKGPHFLYSYISELNQVMLKHFLILKDNFKIILVNHMFSLELFLENTKFKAWLRIVRNLCLMLGSVTL